MCFPTIARIFWNYQVNNFEVRRRVLGKYGKLTDELVKLYRLRSLGQVLHMLMAGVGEAGRTLGMTRPRHGISAWRR